MITISTVAGSPRAARSSARTHAARRRPMEAFGIRRGVERNCALRDAGDSEIVVDAADAEHERVVTNDALGKDLHPVLVADDPEPQLAPLPVEAHDLPLPKPEVVPVGHQEIVDVVDVGVDPARRHFVQQRLPQMRSTVVDERYRRLPAVPERVAEARRERQARGTAPDDNHMMRLCHGVHRSGYAEFAAPRHIIGEEVPPIASAM
jgi:hypothetical protein